MDFLRAGNKPKIVRTRLYGDQEFSRFELELMHTPIVQRLYNLKQLGFTDRVFPDAVHARFNHVLGATELVEKMARKLILWLESHPAEVVRFSEKSGDSVQEVTCAELRMLLEERVDALRLMALLHDLTHAAFGHTLEDEVNVFDEKHDDPRRQVRFFNALTAQLLYLWCTEERLQPFEATLMETLADLNISAENKLELRWAEDLAEYLSDEDCKTLVNHLRNLELAFVLLLHLDFMHAGEVNRPDYVGQLLVTKVADAMARKRESLQFELHRDMFMIDLVGNTICADLLDYARRDADNAGLRIQFDDRFLRYLCVTSVKGDLSPDRRVCIRTAIQVFTDKMRWDTLSEMSGILKARYLINERVLFHPTKCAAGAMLGTAVQLLGLRDLPAWMQVLGDQELLRVLINMAASLENLCGRFGSQAGREKPDPWIDILRAATAVEPRLAEVLEKAITSMLPGAANSASLSSDEILAVRERVRGARNVLWRLMSRRFPKLAYRLRSVHQTGGDTDETIALKYSASLPRYQLERRVEELCHLPFGSIFIHCPKRKTSLKVAEVLVVGSNLNTAAQLKDVTKISDEGLGPYQQEILAIQEMYRSIWQFHVYLDAAHWDKQPIVEWTLERELGFKNDQLLARELEHEQKGAFAMLATDLRDDIPPKMLPQIIGRVDDEVGIRMRFGKTEDDLAERLRDIIKEVVLESEKASGDKPQLGLNLD